MSTAKENRIEIRCSDEEKREFEEAAALAHHVGLSEFIRSAARVYAKHVRDEHQNITLSKKAGLCFLEALDHPPKPNKKLKQAMRRYKKNTKK